MTKPTGIGRGGKRAGAGCKPWSDDRKAIGDKVPPELAPHVNLSKGKLNIEGMSPLAWRTLESIMAFSESDNARVAAARIVLGLTRPAGSLGSGLGVGPALGKKDQARLDAETAGGETDWGDDLVAHHHPRVN